MINPGNKLSSKMGNAPPLDVCGENPGAFQQDELYGAQSRAGLVPGVSAAHPGASHPGSPYKMIALLCPRKELTHPPSERAVSH